VHIQQKFVKTENSGWMEVGFKVAKVDGFVIKNIIWLIFLLAKKKKVFRGSVSSTNRVGVNGEDALSLNCNVPLFMWRALSERKSNSTFKRLAVHREPGMRYVNVTPWERW